MEQFPPKFSRMLVTPDPHYIPGYTGYCPQLKYHMGKPYAQLTAKLLTSPEISRSPRLVLTSGMAPSNARENTRENTKENTRVEIWRRGTGQGRSPPKMIPGFTGFIPRSQNYFSKTYAVTCQEAMNEFDSEQEARIRSASAELQPVLTRAFPDNKPRALNTPLLTISKEPVPCKSPRCWKPLASPYSMENDDPYKYFISGFTGYVPRAKFLVGSSYPITTNKALIQFGKQMKRSHSAFDLTRESSDNMDSMPSIYRTHPGMLPHFTGHVPGYKFRYGQTYGQLTRDSLDMSTTRRKSSEE
ncbi:protein FAM166B [Clarias gariepinus]|uniref:protein FAM166B n=1 Tax=Clarias gariepinus TaxID=13013 RepID=UPI00234DA03B|nr:protein FAM166B [Clarias gariepinus]